MQRAANCLQHPHHAADVLAGGRDQYKAAQVQHLKTFIETGRFV